MDGIYISRFGENIPLSEIQEDINASKKKYDPILEFSFTAATVQSLVDKLIAYKDVIDILGKDLED